jgi:hypothetical protein
MYLAFEVGDRGAGVLLKDLPVQDLNVLGLRLTLQVIQGRREHLLGLLKQQKQQHQYKR